MRKIEDRLQLGVISGLTGVLVKDLVGVLITKAGLAEDASPQMAAGMLLPAQKVASPLGRLAGWLADAAVGSALGIATVYTLSLTGKDRPFLKGLTTGALAWVGLYGVLGNMGATNVRTVKPRTVLGEFLTHTVYGMVTAATAAYLGDEDLFDGGIPWSSSSVRMEDMAFNQARDW